MNQASYNVPFRIGELASELGINPKTIRYYEEIGLLPEPPRSTAGYRLYNIADRERLRFIIKAKAIGLTLEEIGEILALRRDGEQSCEHVLLLLDRKLAAVDHQLRVLKDFRDDLLLLREEAVHEIPRDSAQFCWIIEQHEPHQRDDTSTMLSGKS
nr:heavy metal-responsive transcriptional regulator [Chloroflexia bacterium]